VARRQPGKAPRQAAKTERRRRQEDSRLGAFAVPLCAFAWRLLPPPVACPLPTAHRPPPLAVDRPSSFCGLLPTTSRAFIASITMLAWLLATRYCVLSTLRPKQRLVRLSFGGYLVAIWWQSPGGSSGR